MPSKLTTANVVRRGKRPGVPNGLKWSADQDAMLRELYATSLPTDVIGIRLGRTGLAVRQRAQKLGCAVRPRFFRRPNVRLWGAEEHGGLCDLLVSGLPIREIAARLGRTFTAVRQRVRSQQLRRRLCAPVPLRSGVKLWGAGDDAELRELYADNLSASVIGEKLGRTANAVLNRAWALGLRKSHRVYAPSAGRVLMLRTVTAEEVERVRLMHAAGATAERIVAEMPDSFTAMEPERRVNRLLRRLALAPHPNVERLRSVARQKALARAVRFADRQRALALRYGLPHDLAWRQVQILLLLASGPMTRHEMRALTGVDVSGSVRMGDGRGNLLPDLMRRRLVLSVRNYDGFGRPCPSTYTLTSAAMDLLQAGKAGAP